MYIQIEATRWAWNESKSEGYARLVLLAIAAFCDDEGYSRPGLGLIQEAVNASRPTVLQALEKLESLGEIVIERGRRGPGGTNHYFMQAFSGEMVKKGKEMGSRRERDGKEMVNHEPPIPLKTKDESPTLKRIIEEENKEEEKTPLPLNLEPGRPQPKPVKEPKVRKGFQKTFAKREYVPAPKPPETWNWFAKMWKRYVDVFPVGRPEHWEILDKLYSEFSATGLEDRLSRWLDQRDHKTSAWSALEFLNECPLMDEKEAGDIPAIANEE